MPTNNAANIPTGAIGKILQGQGVGIALDLSTATYPSTATGTGKILRADGTNWVASTATYPDTAGTNTNLLTSDGTNWISSPSTTNDGFITITGSLTSSQVKSLVASPILLIASPGAGKIIKVLSTVGKLNYGGTNAFVCTFSQAAILAYGNTTNFLLNAIIGPAQLTQTANQIIAGRDEILSSSTDYSLVVNQPIYLVNSIGIEISGNAANNNTVTYSITYQIQTI